MSSPPWDSIPLLALKCILENLEEKDAMAASSTCRHWRNGMLLYEGRRDLLKLPSKDLDRCDYLVRLFKKHTRRLHILIGANAAEELQTLMRFILPQFLDSLNLQEIVFVGPVYRHLSPMMAIAQLRRVITETLVYKHARVLEKLAVIGCNLSVLDETDRFVNSQMEYHSKPLSFQDKTSPSILEDLILSRSNVNLMQFCNVKHIVFEYEQISTEALITLSKLENLQMISLNFTSRKGMILPHVDWSAVKPHFKRLALGVNLIHLSESKLEDIMDNALSREMPVTSLKVMFLRDFYMDFILHVAQEYGKTLEEFVWADPPMSPEETTRVIPASDEHRRSPYGHVNPFIYLSWQCRRLRRLDIHGYWTCEYDLLGVTRLRTELQLNASSIFDSTQPLFDHPSGIGGGNVLRVMTTDGPPRIQPVKRGVYQGELNEAQTRQLTPKDWTNLHPGLKVGATPAQRTDYIVSEVLNPLGVT